MFVCLGVFSIWLLTRENPKLKGYSPKTDTISKGHFQEELQNQLVKDINDLGVPGIQVSIIKDREYSFAIGTIDYDRKYKITNDNILRVGSVIKLYTSTIIMKLYEDGIISLDATIDRWFPDIPNAKKITVRSLLNHTSGIYSYTDNYIFIAKTVLFPGKVWEPDKSIDIY